jgi:hypothetical protein
MKLAALSENVDTACIIEYQVTETNGTVGWGVRTSGERRLAP